MTVIVEEIRIQFQEEGKKWEDIIGFKFTVKGKSHKNVVKKADDICNNLAKANNVTVRWEFVDGCGQGHYNTVF